MQNWYPLQGRSNLLKVLAFALVIMICGSSLADAQLVTRIPELSLIPRPNPNANGNGTSYPDDRIYVPRAVDNNTEPRDILVPVFMRNCFIRGTDSRYIPKPIYSFQFKVQYDERVFRAIGVQRFGPLASDTNSLAKEFELAFDDAEDDTYQQTLNVSTLNRFFGRRIRIAGSSTKPLAPTGAAGQTDLFDQNVDCNAREFQELLYIRFRVIGTNLGTGTTNTPIIITNDTLRYNDLDVATESPFPGSADYPTPVGDLDKGLFGLENLANPAEPTRPGVVYAVITDIPRFSFLPSVGPDAKVRQISESQWELTTPIVVETGKPVTGQLGGRGTQTINVIADPSISFTRLTDISVESSAKWLKFMTFGAKNPIPAPVRYGEIDYIDNGILGPGGPGFQNADFSVTTTRDPLLNFRIVVDPSELEPNIKDELDASGIYVGYITFRSASAEYSPVRLKVTFISVRNANEPNNTVGLGRGIVFEVARVGAQPDTARLLIGTGLRATGGVDTLFGEFAYRSPLDGSTFGARLIAVSPFIGGESFGTLKPQYDTNSITDPVQRQAAIDYINAFNNGFGDLTEDFDSRDIRNVNADSTLIYKVRFQRGAGFTTSQVTVSWDTEDFPTEGQLFIRDTLNGTRFSFDLRTAGTGLGGTRRQITINDAAINAFVIEYTLPKVVEFPVINEGWNLLSLPVRPSSQDWNNIYPNRLTNQPIIFSKGIYQDAAFPQVGVGYFVEFGQTVDRRVAGTRLLRIDARDQVIITPGWNTIGSLSVPVNVTDIQFDPGTGLPVRVGAVYGYVTDRGYVEVSELLPGLGYWIKTTGGTGFLRLVASQRAGNIVSNRNEVYSNSAKVKITDARHNGELYLANTAVDSESFEMPPLPPAGMFDVRFANNANVSNEATIRIQGASYPVTVAVENSKANYTVVNAVTGEVLGTIENGSGVQISNSKVRNIKLLQNTPEAANFDMSVMPNPAVNQATITYSLPQASNVTVKVFNTLGQEVETLVDGFVAAGTQPLTFNASTLPTGQYIVKLVAGETVIVRTITVTH